MLSDYLEMAGAVKEDVSCSVGLLTREGRHRKETSFQQPASACEDLLWCASVSLS